MAVSIVLVRDLEQEMASAVEKAKASRAPNTRRIYRIAWATFRAWCEGHGLSPLPASATTLAMYLSSRADQGRALGTIETELSGITAVHTDAGHPSPRGAREVRAVLTGLRRTNVRPVRRVAALTLPEVRAISRALPDTLLGKRDRAIILVGLAAGLRRSELVALQVADVEWRPEGLVLRIARSKTDQEARGAEVGVPMGHGLTCPVSALRAWLEASGITLGPLFLGVRKGGHLVVGELSDKAVALVVKRRAEEVGIDPTRVSGHSLRATMATLAVAAGANLPAVARQGRWSGLGMLARYVRPGHHFEDNAMAGVGL